MATTLKSTEVVASLAHAVLMNFTHSLGWWLIEIGHTDVGYRPLKSIVAKETASVLSELEGSTPY